MSPGIWLFFFFVSFSVCTKPEKCSQMLCVLKMSAISLRVSAFRDVFYNHSFRDSSVGPLNVDSACSQKERQITLHVGNQRYSSRTFPPDFKQALMHCRAPVRLCAKVVECVQGWVHIFTLGGKKQKTKKTARYTTPIFSKFLFCTLCKSCFFLFTITISYAWVILKCTLQFCSCDCSIFLAAYQNTCSEFWYEV